MTWVKATTVEELQNCPQLFRASPKQIALFQVDGRSFAVDNRCPHEGYPLIEGSVDEACLLTCNWHNWKFRLEDGQCVLGGDHVRSYPTREENGEVWIDLSDPPADELLEKTLVGLKVAFDERDFGRICREITRLHYYQLDPEVAVWKAIEWSHDRWEFGTTHAYAAAADWLTLAREQHEIWDRRLVCLAETVDHMAFDALRRPQFPYAAVGDEFDAAAFTEAIEAEDRETAEGMVLRAMGDGLHWPELEPAFTKSALAHYNDFGHSLIYVLKTRQLLEQGGAKLEPFLLPALARHLIYTTREDLIPEFQEYGAALAQIDEPNKELPESGELFGASVRQALEWVIVHRASEPVEAVYDQLLCCLARNLLHYNLECEFVVEQPVSRNKSWLHFTHGITFANAVREMCNTYPEYWNAGLLQMACFIGRNRGYLDEAINESEWFVADDDEFFGEAFDRILDHGLRDPIFSAHLLKTTIAVRDECAHASDDCGKYLLAGLNRFLHSPIKQKHTRRLAHQAIALVKRDFD